MFGRESFYLKDVLEKSFFTCQTVIAFVIESYIIRNSSMFLGVMILKEASG